MKRSKAHSPEEIFYSFSNMFIRKHSLLQKHLVGLGLSLSEAKILHALAGGEVLNCSALREKLQLDAGYLSRMLKGFEKSDLIHKRASQTDRRNVGIVLTAKGKKLQTQLEAMAREEIGQWLTGVSDAKRLHMVRAMQLIEGGLKTPALGEAVRFREPGIGDISFVVYRQAALYRDEYGWGAVFEGLLHHVADQMIANAKPDRERGWIAEYGGEIVGSLFLVEQEPGIAQLRMLYVEPHVRGMGIGRDLLTRAVGYAVEKRYRSVRLWTNSTLVSARAMYEKAGFVMIEEAPDTLYAPGAMLQIWAKGII